MKAVLEVMVETIVWFGARVSNFVCKFILFTHVILLALIG